MFAADYFSFHISLKFTAYSTLDSANTSVLNVQNHMDLSTLEYFMKGHIMCILNVIFALCQAQKFTPVKWQ